MAKGSTINEAKDLLVIYCYGHLTRGKLQHYTILLAMRSSRCVPWKQLLLICSVRYSAAEMCDSCKQSQVSEIIHGDVNTGFLHFFVKKCWFSRGHRRGKARQGMRGNLHNLPWLLQTEWY